VITSKVFHKENDQNASVLSLNMERLNLIDSSMTFWEKIENNVCSSYFQIHLKVDFVDSMNFEGNPIISYEQQDIEVHPKSLENDMNYVSLVVVLDPEATEPDVVVIPDLVATELEVILVPNLVATEITIINASDTIAIESTNAVVPDSVEPKEQHVLISPVSIGYNNEFWGQFLQNES